MMASTDKVKALIDQGENTCIEFKSSQVRPESLANEITAMLNTKGGEILIGVEDDKSITGIDVNEKNWEEWVANICRDLIIPPLMDIYVDKITYSEKTILLISVPKGKDKPYQDKKNHFLVRVGSTNRVASQNELLRLFQASGTFHYDLIALEGSQYRDLDMNRLSNYFDQFNIVFQEEENKELLLKNIDIMDASGVKLTIGGNLVFGINPQRFMPNASITFASFKGSEISEELLDKKVFVGTLPQQVDSCLSAILAVLPEPSKIIGAKTVSTKSNYDSKVYRELIVNACVHRDYSIAGSRIRVFLFSDRLEVISPGRLPNTVSPDKMKYGVSYARNPILVKFMENMRYIDKMGRGIPMVYQSAQKLGKKVILEELGDEFKVTLEL